MVNITLVPGPINKTWCAVLSLGLAVPMSNFMNADLRFGFFLLLVIIMLFWKMVLEDAETGTIDIRYIAILSVGLFICSRQPASVYLFTNFSYLILFRMLYIASSLWTMAIQYYQHRNVITAKRTAKKPSIELNGRVPFLPCFAGGLLLMELGITFFDDSAAVIWSFDDALYFCITLLDNEQKIILLAIMLLVLGIFELGYRLAQKRRDPVICIGMGDVLILPAFATFLGSGCFGVTLGCALLMSIVLVLYQTYQSGGIK